MGNRLVLVLAGSAVSFSLACASNGTKAAKQQTSASVASAAGESGRVVALKSELTPDPRLLVRTEGKAPYVYYSPQPDVFVIDFTRAAKQPDLSIPTNLPQFIASVSADEAMELDQHLTRVTVRFAKPTTVRPAATENGVVLKFEPVAQAAAETEVDPAEVPVMAGVTTERVAVSNTVAVEEPLGAQRATQLRGIETTGSGSTLQIRLNANGSVDYKAFRLTNPLRLVVDLNGVKNKTKRSTIELGDPFVKRVRVSQWKPDPNPITRVVFDLDEIVEYSVARSGEELRVAFGESALPPDVPMIATTAPVAGTNGMNGDHRAGSNDSSGGTNGNHGTNGHDSLGTNGQDLMPISANVTAKFAADPEPQTTPSPTITYTGSAQSAAAAAAQAPSTPVEDVFVDPQQQTTTSISGVQPGGQRQLSPNDRMYTGEPLTLNLKDADIKDVLRTFAQLTGLNIAIDPNVQGTVTVQFENVPWDQALELILRQNGLTYVLQGNVMRVGTIERLALEQQLNRKLEEEERLNVPLQTIIRRLSYAKAEDVQRLAKELASPRGRIIVDPRTNQLIITDVPEYIPTLLSLIENVDIATPQVVIEARIVETTKDFAQQLGIRWNFGGTLDPALGTGTGLVFPNRVGIVGGPFSFAAGAPDVLRFTLSDVLGTFDLDIALTAAEREGLARVVSAPKVTTQDNQAAEIESGIQVPVQTRINFTTTTTYVNATLRLEVTPQITAADTVIMQINVQKTEPGATPEGASAPPLRTRRAQTRLMVRDGGTTVIGGIYQATDNRTETRVPFVHELPVVGNLFKGRSFSTVHDELLIFITPRIVRNT